MKHLNFINAISPTEQKKIARWYRIVLMSIIGMVLGTTIVHSWQLRRIMQLRSFYNSLLHNAPKYEKTSNEYAQTVQKHEQLASYCKECTVLHEQLEQSIRSLSLPEAITTCPDIRTCCWTLNAQSFTATLQSATVSEGLNCIHTLQKLPIINTLTIASLQSHDTNTQRKVTLQLQGTLHSKEIAK